MRGVTGILCAYEERSPRRTPPAPDQADILPSPLMGEGPGVRVIDRPVVLSLAQDLSLAAVDRPRNKFGVTGWLVWDDGLAKATYCTPSPLTGREAGGEGEKKGSAILQRKTSSLV